MTEKDKEINELRRKVADLQLMVDELTEALVQASRENEEPELFKSVRKVYKNCIYTDTCKDCVLHDTEGCMVELSPYRWRMPK